MNIPKTAVNIIKRLNEASYEAYFVGGCVRDMLMGKEPLDWDITTSAQPSEIKAIFKKTVDTGIKHGTVTVLTSGASYEVTTYRLDGKYADYRHPDEVIFAADLKEDIKRRDFTVNAIAYHPNEGYIDFFGGKDDIKAGIIRGVGDPDERFSEDALRMLRAIRFAAQLGFSIEDNTFSALCKNTGLISHVSMERIRDEFIKTFTAEHVEKAGYFARCKILDHALPFMAGYLRENLERFTAFVKNLKKHERVSANVLSLLFAYCRDSREVISHLKAMKTDNATIRSVTAISQEIRRKIPKASFDIKSTIVRTGTANFFSLLVCKEACGEDVDDIKVIAEAIIKRCEPLFIKDMRINGNILKERFNISGVKVGEALHALHAEVLKDPLNNTEEYLLETAAKLLEGVQ